MSTRWRAIFTIWLIIFSVVVADAVRANRIQAHKGAEAKAALCIFKADLKQRADAGDAFLAKHPDGIPGIPASVIRTSLKNQRATIDSLRALKCKGD